MCQYGYYRHLNPLIDTGTGVLHLLEQEDNEEGTSPRMPAISGVVESLIRRESRLSDSYFKLEEERWIPQVVDDPTLFARVLRGGRQLKHWELREE